MKISQLSNHLPLGSAWNPQSTSPHIYVRFSPFMCKLILPRVRSLSGPSSICSSCKVYIAMYIAASFVFSSKKHEHIRYHKSEARTSRDRTSGGAQDYGRDKNDDEHKVM